MCFNDALTLEACKDKVESEFFMYFSAVIYCMFFSVSVPYSEKIATSDSVPIEVKAIIPVTTVPYKLMNFC